MVVSCRLHVGVSWVCHLVTHSDHQTTLGVNCLTIPDGFALDSVLLRFEEDT